MPEPAGEELAGEELVRGEVVGEEATGGAVVRGTPDEVPVAWAPAEEVPREDVSGEEASGEEATRDEVATGLWRPPLLGEGLLVAGLAGEVVPRALLDGVAPQAARQSAEQAAKPTVAIANLVTASRARPAGGKGMFTDPLCAPWEILANLTAPATGQISGGTARGGAALVMENSSAAERRHGVGAAPVALEAERGAATRRQ